MSYIKNRDRLLSHGIVKMRQAALKIIEYALEHADPYKAVQSLVRFDGSQLTVGNLQLNLEDHQRIFLLGAGKATYPIARALEEIFGDRITDGVVICKHGQVGRLSRSRLFLASHPVPDMDGFEAAREALALARLTKPGDIVFGCITGGSSALMPYPVEGVSIEEKMAVNKQLLTCGANIYEINAVRKHLSQIKAGEMGLNAMVLSAQFEATRCDTNHGLSRRRYRNRQYGHQCKRLESERRHGYQMAISPTGAMPMTGQ
jgi:glycerate-2-kinase